MNALQQILQFITKLVQWWVIIEPWEQGVRVRLGNRLRLLHPGIHFRIPFIDAVYPQNVRLRTISTASQTVTSQDGQLITTSGVIRLRVHDVMLLQTTLNDAPWVLNNIVCGLVADFVADNNFADISPGLISKYVNARLDFEKYGLADCAFVLQDYAAPKRVFRLIMDPLGSGAWNSNMLTTNGPSRDGANKEPAQVVE